MDNAINELLVDLGCFERGCVCYDHQDQVPPVEMVRKKEWVGLTDGDFAEACQIAERGNYLVAFKRIQEKLKEKNT